MNRRPKVLTVPSTRDTASVSMAPIVPQDVELKRGATGKLDHNQRPAYDPVLAQRTYQENIRRRGSGPKRKEVKK